jgi:hypothetical protein
MLHHTMSNITGQHAQIAQKGKATGVGGLQFKQRRSAPKLSWKLVALRKWPCPPQPPPRAPHSTRDVISVSVGGMFSSARFVLRVTKARIWYIARAF